jgi:retron-type reverse transcriptase
MELMSERLTEAFSKTARNKGVAGPDRQSVEYVRKHWSTVEPRLKAALLDGSNRPGEIRRVWIPKAGGGERGLWIPNVVDRDLEKFFDRVNHQRPMARLAQRVDDKRLLVLIGRMLKAKVVMPDGVVVSTEEGVPQGGPL